MADPDSIGLLTLLSVSALSRICGWPCSTSSSRLLKHCSSSRWVMVRVSWRRMMGITRDSDPLSSVSSSRGSLSSRTGRGDGVMFVVL
ncbi:hypothetical protein EYF80_005491 [Liparis tanakae]|uniref:Uncharacterized protein n=1 Tax=Liparis tanakae TaxID=230148 RepID=A0A4Z2J2T8_9TELE|nr:hypothetical protein EYF80_005491 [Liparis tanakae]